MLNCCVETEASFTYSSLTYVKLTFANFKFSILSKASPLL
ncbi:pentapeptide repeat-containing protein [Polaribacter sp. 11A2H]